MKRSWIALKFDKIRPVLCFSLALLLIGGTVSSPISFWLSYNQKAFADSGTGTLTVIKDVINAQ